MHTTGIGLLLFILAELTLPTPLETDFCTLCAGEILVCLGFATPILVRLNIIMSVVIALIICYLSLNGLIYSSNLA